MNKQNILSKIVGVSVLLTSVVGSWIYMDLKTFTANPLQVGAQGVVYTVAKGSSLKALAHDLGQREIIRHPTYLVWLGRWRDIAHQIQAGEYLLTPGMNPEQLLDLVASGKVLQYPLTIVEGWTFRQLLQAMHHHDQLKHTLSGLSDAEIMATIGFPGQHPEGRFLPDTYHFPRDTTDAALLQRAYQASSDFLEQNWPSRQQGLRYKTPYEALILASIVEKETALPSEREQIAGVFVRRLNKGMRLQTDPTVIYGMGEDFDGNIRRRDLRLDTPYNTYIHRGLPPTPIAMPGRASIYAALHPAAGEELYFVSRGDGSHYFSASLEQHNEAVRKYQLAK